MSSYTKENLIHIPPTAVPAGTLAIKVGNEIFTPGNIRITSGMEFYKCASVDTVNKTWTGYKAVLTDGVYTFDDTAIAGLTFGTAFIPAVGSIYNADATVAVSGLWQGRDPALLFYAPLTSAAATAETGQTLTASGNVQYTSQNGKACAYFPGSNASITANIEDFPISELDITIAAWLLFTQPNSALDNLVSFGGYQSIMEYDGALRWTYTSGNYIQKEGAVTDKNWHFVAVTAGLNKLCLYIDGVLSVTKDGTMRSDGVSPLTIGGGSGAVRNLYVYNRCLSADEIAELYNK